MTNERNMVRDKVENEVYFKLSKQVKDQVYDRILTQVRRELSIQLNRQVVIISRINVTQNMKL
jgi:hypothetical protein